MFFIFASTFRIWVVFWKFWFFVVLAWSEVGRDTGNWGWCVGRNPPFVFCGIRLIGLPAPQVDSSQASVCPFHLQDSRFTVSHPAFSTSPCIIGTCRVDVSFLLRSQGSRLTPLRALQFYTWAEFPQAFLPRLESHTPTRQPNYLTLRR